MWDALPCVHSCSLSLPRTRSSGSSAQGCGSSSLTRGGARSFTPPPPRCSLPCPPYQRSLIQPHSALWGKKKSKRESSHSKPQTMSQIMPRSTEVLPLPSHALVEEGRRKGFPPAQLAASWNLWLAQLALPSSSSCVFSNGLVLRPFLQPLLCCTTSLQPAAALGWEGAQPWGWEGVGEHQSLPWLCWHRWCGRAAGTGRSV